MSNDFYIETRARRVSGPRWVLVSGFFNLVLMYCSTLRSTTESLLELSVVTTQITHYNYQTWQLGRRPGKECPL